MLTLWFDDRNIVITHSSIPMGHRDIARADFWATIKTDGSFWIMKNRHGVGVIPTALSDLCPGLRMKDYHFFTLEDKDIVMMKLASPMVLE